MKNQTKESWVIAQAVQHPLISFIILAIVSVGIIGLYGHYLPTIINCIGGWCSTGNDPNGYKGLFGDSFGALTSLFSVLAMMALFLTFLYQKKQIDIQKEQLLDERENVKYQQIPLLSLSGLELTVPVPYCATRGHLATAMVVRYGLRAGNEFLVKDAFVRLTLRCGTDGERETLQSCRSFAGIGGGSEPSASETFFVKQKSYADFAGSADIAPLIGEKYSVSVEVTIYYRSMLGLHICLHREFGIGESKDRALELIKKWSGKLPSAPRLSGDWATDYMACCKHFCGSLPKTEDARFALIEFTGRGSFEAISKERFDQEVGSAREK